MKSRVRVFFFPSMLTERKDGKCSEGGIWLVRYERESWCFFNVVLQQSRRRVCGTLQNSTIVGECRENHRAEHWPCWLPKADIMCTEYLSRVRKRKKRKVCTYEGQQKRFFCRNASNVQWRRHISTKLNVEAESNHTLEGKLCKRKGKSKGKIILLQKKYRRLLE